MCPGGYPIAESTQNWQVGVPARRVPGTVHRQPAHRHREADRAHQEPARLARRSASAASSTLLQELNGEHLAASPATPDLEARIQSFELAFRMQTEAADAFDVSQEPKSHPRDATAPASQARQTPHRRAGSSSGVCGYVQLWHGEGSPGTATTTSKRQHRRLAKAVRPGDRRPPRPTSSSGGLLEDTLVIWGGEFGRTPTVELPTAGANQGKMNGRDHNHYGFTMWLAGGGVKGASHPRRDRRASASRRSRTRPRPRPPRHDPPPARLRPRDPHLPLRRPRLPPDRRARRGGQGHPRLISAACSDT